MISRNTSNRVPPPISHSRLLRRGDFRFTSTRKGGAPTVTRTRKNRWWISRFIRARPCGKAASCRRAYVRMSLVTQALIASPLHGGPESNEAVRFGHAKRPAFTFAAVVAGGFSLPLPAPSPGFGPRFALPPPPSPLFFCTAAARRLSFFFPPAVPPPTP